MNKFMNNIIHFVKPNCGIQYELGSFFSAEVSPLHEFGFLSAFAEIPGKEPINKYIRVI